MTDEQRDSALATVMQADGWVVHPEIGWCKTSWTTGKYVMQQWHTPATTDNLIAACFRWLLSQHDAYMATGNEDAALDVMCACIESLTPEDTSVPPLDRLLDAVVKCMDEQEDT